MDACIDCLEKFKVMIGAKKFKDTSYLQGKASSQGPVHMGRSYLGCRENISTGQIMLFCLYGEMFSRLPGKVSRCDVDFIKCKQKVFPLSGKVVFIWDKNYLGHRDLACQQARSRLSASEISVPGKTFRPI